MPAAAFDGSVTTGHGCHPPNNIIEGSSNVSINGNPASHVGNGTDPHTCGNDTHDGSISSGSSSVKINGQPAARIGDDVNCGSVVAQGSTNVFIGG